MIVSGSWDNDRIREPLPPGANQITVQARRPDGSGIVTQIERTLNVVVFPGDADGDGSVTIRDFLALSRNFSKAGGLAEGDFDGDGVVTIRDFLALSRNFGKRWNSSE